MLGMAAAFYLLYSAKGMKRPVWMRKGYGARRYHGVSAVRQAEGRPVQPAVFFTPERPNEDGSWADEELAALYVSPEQERAEVQAIITETGQWDLAEIFPTEVLTGLTGDAEWDAIINGFNSIISELSDDSGWKDTYRQVDDTLEMVTRQADETLEEGMPGFRAYYRLIREMHYAISNSDAEGAMRCATDELDLLDFEIGAFAGCEGSRELCAVA